MKQVYVLVHNGGNIIAVSDDLRAFAQWVVNGEDEYRIVSNVLWAAVPRDLEITVTRATNAP